MLIEHSTSLIQVYVLLYNCAFKLTKFNSYLLNSQPLVIMQLGVIQKRSPQIFTNFRHTRSSLVPSVRIC